MDAITPVEKRFLPALAEAIAVWFPELGGRALAVSDITVTKENIPTLPLCLVAFTRSLANPPTRNSYEEIHVQDAFIVEFWLEPMRYKRTDSSETPFWTYYPYDTIRDKLLTNITQWQSPGKERIAYRTLTISADAMAVMLTFGFTANFEWCPKVDRYGIPFEISVNLCTPVACVPEICEPDPCA